MPEWTHDALVQTVTWWRVTGHDGTGKPSFAAPVAIKGRWEGRTRRFADGQGEVRVSRAEVRVDRDVSAQDWLALGRHTSGDPRTVSGAGPVQDFQAVPDSAGEAYDRVALL